ncbi:MAG: DUF1631 domain-containing protein [Gammaproteobacteria bacterium]|nr:DUF1631 domain-containing protein [Gammaproteobacteria bacterium]
MIYTGRNNQARAPQGMVAEIINPGRSLLAKCLIKLLGQARDSSFRNDHQARDLYTRYDALDALAAFHKRITRTCLKQAESNFLDPVCTDPSNSAHQNDPDNIQVIELDDIYLSEQVIPLAESLTMQFADPLLRLEVCLEQFNKILPNKINTLGWHPLALLEAFLAGIKQLSIKVEGKIFLCQCFQAQLSNHLGDLYHQLNQILSDQGIVDDNPRLSKAVASNHRQRKKTIEDGAESRPNISAISTPQIDPFLLFHLAADAPGTGSILSAYQRAQIVGALSVVQRDCAMKNHTLSSNDIKVAIARVLYDSGTFNATELVKKEAMAIDFVERIFNTISEDASLHIAGKNLISKLQIPTLKLALLDFSFLQNPAHPARKMLNLLATCLINIVDKKDPVSLKLRSIVHHLLTHFDTDVSVFEHALSNIEKVAPRAKERADTGNKKTLSTADDNRRSAANGMVNHTINYHLKNNSIHRPAQRFIVNGWAPYMTKVYLEKGLKNQAWHRCTGLLTELIHASKIPAAQQDSATPSAYTEKLLNEIQQKLSDSFSAQSTELMAFNELRGKGNAPRSGRKESNVLSVDELCAGDRVTTNDTGANTTSTNSLQKLPSYLIPGTWFEIHSAKGEGKRILKLSSVLKETNQVLFTNRSRDEKLTIDLTTFLDDLERGQSKLFDDSNLFDRALSTVISNIQQAHQKHHSM